MSAEETPEVKKGNFPNGHGNQGGNEGNRYGAGRRPNEGVLTREIRRRLNLPSDDPQKTTAEALVEALLKHFIDGNAAAIKQVMDRVEGPIIAKSEITGLDGGPIQTSGVDLSKATTEDLMTLLPILEKLQTQDK